MANTNEVEISGTVPFDVTSHEKARAWLGMLNGPSYGLRIAYDTEFYVRNEHGGATATYPFKIRGIEAVWTSNLLDLVTSLQEAGATIEKARARDLDNRDNWANLI